MYVRQTKVIANTAVCRKVKFTVSDPQFRSLTTVSIDSLQKGTSDDYE